MKHENINNNNPNQSFESHWDYYKIFYYYVMHCCPKIKWVWVLTRPLICTKTLVQREMLRGQPYTCCHFMPCINKQILLNFIYCQAKISSKMNTLLPDLLAILRFHVTFIFEWRHGVVTSVHWITYRGVTWWKSL